MAENMENNVVDAEVKEETAMATTQQSAETAEMTKTDYIGIAKAAKVILGVGGAALCFFAGVAKGKAKSAAKDSNEDIVDAEPTNSEDEVSE